MKKCAVLLLAVTGFVFCGCDKRLTDIQLNQEFVLQHKNVAIVQDGKKRIRIKFKEVEDSRCPAGMTCFWEGMLVAILEIDKKDKVRISAVPGPNGPGPEVKFGDYTYHMSALNDKDTKSGTFEATLKVTK